MGKVRLVNEKPKANIHIRAGEISHVVTHIPPEVLEKFPNAVITCEVDSIMTVQEFVNRHPDIRMEIFGNPKEGEKHGRT